MKLNWILISFVTDAQMHEQAESNMSLQLFQSWGHKKSEDVLVTFNLQPHPGS